MVSGLFSQLFSMGLTASWVILVVMLVRLLFQRLRLPKKYSYYLWAVPALRLLCPVSVSASFSLFNLNIFRTNTEGIAAAVEQLAAGRASEDAFAGLAAGAQEIAQGAGTAAGAASDMLKTGGTAAAAEAAGAAGNTAGNISGGAAAGLGGVQKILDGITGGSVGGEDLLRMASWIWLAGLALILLYSLFCWLRLRRTVHMAVHRQENIYECGGISSPFVLGLLRPRIYIPFRLSEREREYIIRHEAFHIKRKDIYIKALAFFLAAVYWFHPFVWIAFFCMGRDMEMSCDEHVLAEMGSGIKKDYSISLLSFASNRRLHSSGPLSFGEKDAQRRIKNILGFRKTGRWAAAAGTLIILIIAAICLTNATGGADGTGADRAGLNGAEDAAGAGINGTEDAARPPETVGTVKSTEGGQPEESSPLPDNKQEEGALPDIYEVMSRVFENCWMSRRMLSFGDVVPEDGDYMVRLAATEDGLYEAYGCVSPEYGYRGIYMNFRLDGIDNFNEVDTEWVNVYDGPKLAAADYDGDGRDEAALAFLEGSGTGLYLEKLLVFETYDTAHMEPCELSGEKIEEEIGRLLDQRVDTAEKTVDIIVRGTDDVILEGLSYALEEHEDAGFEDVSYGSQRRYALGEQIYLYVGVGILNNIYPEPDYPGKNVAFRVIYEDPEAAGKDCFRLADPAQGVFGAMEERSAGFDVQAVLVPADKVADIRVTNGNTGTVFMVGTQEEKEHILEAYAGLDIRPGINMEKRSGYAYRMQLLDGDGNVLQTVTPYKDAVTLDGEIYDGSVNHTAEELLLAVSAAKER